MAPVLSRSDGTRRPVRWAMISAQIDTAVSSGVRAPMSSPIGEWSRSSCIRVVHAGFGQPLHPLVVGRPAAHHPDVADPRGERAEQRRHVELRVVGEYADRVARAERRAALVEHRRRPGDEHLVGHREATTCGEHLAGVAHRDAVPEHLGHPRQRGSEVDRTEDPHLRRRGVRFDEHAHRGLVEQILGRRLSLRAVVADARGRRFELGEGVAADDPVEFGMAERPDRRPRRARRGSSQPTFGPSMTVASATGRSVRSASAKRSNVPVTSRVPRCTGGSSRRTSARRRTPRRRSSRT